MNGAERVLVVILSTALALFLVLAITAVVIAIQILRQIKRIMAKAETIADKAEAVTDFFQRSAGPVAIGRLISNLANNVFQMRNKRKSRRGGNDEEE